ncbi:SDR family oxidoreductase [Alicyclobacillus cycloheptanicus]|uniref:3-oxoacyl-[acyl-carrier protein] reductase n=1 Tax=Alicyclobacillus cycloheptanicus TaxID=1457 RepID=A0ABT9XHU8_9BACL|nr:SDR family NAD(P)-dependent oxidoreductase [Alicyclobacillus cycloheptanicus]MDQ0189884.1 3-oxoacyl-[acyl-carrier protein] reductase [Alicyclobacillus cycloheptanicus]WDM02211.1 SDR family oxidoreductase [Alicyclobacillus cycloheptanicus]
MEEEFRGKRVLITGAAGVIGRWIAEAFAAEGARLWLSDIREPELATFVNGLPSSTGEVVCDHTDLTDADAVYDLSDRIAQRWGAPDIVINNAGIYPRHRLLQMSVEDWNRTMRLNVTAPFIITQSTANLMIEHRIQGSIVNIISGAACTVGIGGGHYSTSKAALAMLTRAFALELAAYGIRVNAVGPGFAPGSEVSGLSDEYVQNMISTIPLGRTSGPEDAPAAILFLCSKKASFITGTALHVDGGRLAGLYKRS